MKKLLLVLSISTLGLTGIAAPSWDKYISILQSDNIAYKAKVAACQTAVDILVAQPNPTSVIEIKRYNFAHEILAAKADSKVITTIVSFMVKDGVLTDLNDAQNISDNIINYIQTNFDIIGKIY